MADTRWLDDEEQRTWRSFVTASRLLWDRVERQLQQGAGLPHAYYEILVRLSEAPDRTLRMSQLRLVVAVLTQPAAATPSPGSRSPAGCAVGPARPTAAARWPS